VRANKRADGFYLYGSVALKRQFCPECREDAIVLDGELQCCDRPVTVARKYRRISENRIPRQRPRRVMRDWLLNIQGNRCAYCGSVFGEFIENTKTGKVIQVRLQWDHAVPYSFLRTNPKNNWLAACHICNGIKNNKMFDSLADARAVVVRRRAKRGFAVGDIPAIDDVFEVMAASGGGPDKLPAGAWT